MPALAGISLGLQCRQRKLLTATVPSDAPSAAVKDAGTWRGNDIAAAATIVARSSRRVHMFASGNGLDQPSGYGGRSDATASRLPMNASEEAGSSRQRTLTVQRPEPPPAAPPEPLEPPAEPLPDAPPEPLPDAPPDEPLPDAPLPEPPAAEPLPEAPAEPEAPDAPPD